MMRNTCGISIMKVPHPKPGPGVKFSEFCGISGTFFTVYMHGKTMYKKHKYKKGWFSLPLIPQTFVSPWPVLFLTCGIDKNPEKRKEPA